MALVNPNIAMSFRQPEFRPRNALAEYAQIQQIMGGQRQAEVADMQMEALRRERDALGQIQAAIVAKGGPPDLEAAADAMIKTGRPEYLTQGMAIRTALRNQRAAEAYRRDFGGGATPANAMVAPAAAAPSAPAGELVAAPIAPPTGTVRDIAPGGAISAPMPLAANALAPVAPVNAMAAPTAAPDANATRLAALEARYNRIGNNPELASEKALLLKQIEAALRGGQDKTPQIREIGVATKTNEPVYFDARTDQQFTIGTDPSGRQVRVPYTGGVNRATSSVTATATSQLPPQEKAFESELGKGQAERILKSQAGARDAVNIIDTVNTGRQIMQSGMITGAGAEFLVNLNQALKTVGIDAGYADASANSQAFAANMAGNVGRIIKQFGAGTGLSNADREYAEKMAGGKITLDSKAISRILDINERAARNVIKLHNKDVSGIKTNIPLTVEEPPATRAGTAQIPGATPATSIPQAAIDDLKAGRGTDAQFDAIFGAGAAKRVRGGK